VPIPAELEAALRDVAPARERFDALSSSHRKEYAQWVGDAKKSETRVSRARKAIDMILAGPKGR
jgi:uncharacterized protein YdeI (YjbR/CyaY-like superfamily)